MFAIPLPGVVPHCAISVQFADHVGVSHSGVTPNVHYLVGFTNVREQASVAEDIDRGLIVQQDPALWEHLFFLVERHSFT